MKITKRQLRQLIREEKQRLLSESHPNPYAKEIAIEVMEDTLNNLWQEGFGNEDLIEVLDQLKLHVQQGFIGEPA